MRVPRVDEVYNGFHCPNFDYIITLILPDDKNLGRSEVYGTCQNPNCSTGEDEWRGVDSCDVDDFNDTLTNGKVTLASGFYCDLCGSKADPSKKLGHKVVCEVCWSEQ